MKIPVKIGGIYSWTLRDALTNEIVDKGEKHNIVTLSGWNCFLQTDDDSHASLVTYGAIALSPDAMSEVESVTNLTNQTLGTEVNPVVINQASPGVPKNFVYHYQFAIPPATVVWKTIGLYHTYRHLCMAFTSLTSNITQLGNETPTPQILDLYYTLYFDYDENAIIANSMNGGRVLENFVEVFSERPYDLACNLYIDPYATLSKNMSTKLSDYLIESVRDVYSSTNLTGLRFPEYGNKTTIDIVDDTNDLVFKRKASINWTNTNEIGKIFGSVGLACLIQRSDNRVPLAHYGVFWPITKNPAVTPIQNVFSHKPESTIPFEYSFRSTGKLVFDDSALVLDVLPSWYQVNYLVGGNAADGTVKFSVKRGDTLGFRGNTYFPDIFYNYEGRNENQAEIVGYNIPFVYPNALQNCPNIDNMRYCYSLYNQKEVLWFGNDYIVKQNLINADYSIIRNGTTVGFSGTAVKQMAILTPSTGPKTIFVACRDTGIWRISEDFNTVLLCDATGISGVTNHCYGIAIGYNNRVWALMEGGLIYSDNAGNTWSAASFAVTAITSNWGNVQYLYAGTGTNRHILLFVSLPETSTDFCEYTWYNHSTSTAGAIVRGTGFDRDGGPRQISIVPGYDCFLAKAKDTSTFLKFSMTESYPSQSVALAYNAIDVLLDKSGNFFVVHRDNSYSNWLSVSDFFGSCRIGVLAGSLPTQSGMSIYYSSFALMGRTSPVVFQSGSAELKPRLASRQIDPNNYKCRMLDFIYDDWRCNPASNQFVKGFTYPAKDITLNSLDGVRLNFPVENIMFQGGSAITLKDSMSIIRPKLVTSGECTIAMVVRPTEILTNASYNANVLISSLLSFVFDLNKEAKTTSAFSIQIHPTIRLTGYSASNMTNTHIFAQNEISGNKMFDVDKTNRVVITITPNSIKLYVNGAQVGLECVSCVGMDLSKLSDIIIGQSFIRSFGFKGYIDYIQVWDKVFTASDVAFDYSSNNYINVTASATYNPTSTLTDSNLIVHYKLVNQTISSSETKTMDTTTIHEFANGLKLKFEDNPNIATSYFDKDYYTFGVVDGMLKDNQMVFGEDYFLTFVR